MAQEDEPFDGEFLSRLEQVRLQVRRRFAGRLRAERRSRRTGSSLEFADYRNYVSGDDPRRIDWSIYGRVERLMVKLFEEEEDLDVSILVDCSGSMHWRPRGSPRIGKFSLARQVAAALAYLALHGLDRVALWFFDSGLRAESERFRGRPAFHDVLRFLRSAIPAPGRTDLASSLRVFGLGQRRRGLAIVLSDCLDPAGCETGLGTLVGGHFALHLVHILDFAEYRPEDGGDLLLRDCETGTEIPVTVSASLLEGYHHEAERFCKDIKSWCGSHGAGYSFVTTGDSFSDVVLRVLRGDALVR